MLRPPRPGDGDAMFKAAKETAQQLKRWMPWAQGRLSVHALEEYARRGHAQWTLREDLPMAIFDRSGKKFLGSTGMHRIDWTVPRFELGYWLRKSAQGYGYAREATLVLTHFCFDHLKAKRVEIRCDDKNAASMKIPEALGFVKEGLLLQDAIGFGPRTTYYRNTLVYAVTKKSQVQPLAYRTANSMSSISPPTKKSS